MEHCLGMIAQAPIDTVAQIDRDKFLSAFSLVDENWPQIQAKPWDLGPGWTGNDINKKYEQNPRMLMLEEVKKLWNSDMLSDIPYGNDQLVKACQDWQSLWEAHVQTHPLCHALGEVETEDSMNPRKRKSCWTRARTVAQDPVIRAHIQTSHPKVVVAGWADP
ncbi:hypothetical protein BT96DRAFT_1003847 [Gymnopus androsaceus JB14]|uniref:Uncharacterized protein n=1 Tax=Gymnopus androsaceus JB14 TaxID=1447944 RepID=A0A6A4GUL1_9AGAR|nr:hypothetical protein BT96DRAFT_1003847 [Gymnopus androsaceus JB14]